MFHPVKQLRQPRGRTDRFATGIGDGVDGVAACDRSAAFGLGDLDIDSQPLCLAGQRAAASHFQQIIVPGVNRPGV